MRYKLFGRSGLRVSELCLGTLSLGGNNAWSCNATDGIKILNKFAEAGGNFIDTANLYNAGESEKLVGEFIKSDRDHFVVSTKYSTSDGHDILRAGNSRRNMIRSLEESLKRLNTDYVDIYWLHIWDFTTSIDEIMRGFDDMVSSGKVHYVAVCNATAWQISRANMLADLRGWAPFIGIQILYSLADRTAERDLLPMARELDLGVAAWGMLAGGILSGKYLQGATQEHSRYRNQSISDHDNTVASLVTRIAREAGCTPSQLALSAVRGLQNPVIPIIGVRHLAQLQDNIGALSVTLDEEQLRQLDEATRIDYGFPHTTILSADAHELVTAGHAERLDNHRRQAF